MAKDLRNTAALGCRAAAVCLALAVASAAWAQQPLLQRLKAEFEGRPVVVRLSLGSYVVYNHPSTGQPLPRLVDTEYSPDGTVKYYVTRGFAGSAQVTDLLVRGFYARSDAVAMMPPGTAVWVTKVELKDDRVELFLSKTQGQMTASDYAKLKVMLGRGFQSWDYERIVGVIARGLKVERFERLYGLEDEYRSLKVALGNAEGLYKSTPPQEADARLAAALRLQGLCRSLADNRSQYAALGQATSTSEGPEFAARAAALEGEIAQIRLAQNAARLKGLQDQCAVSLATARTLSAEGRTLKVASEADWQRKSQWVGKYEVALADVRKTHAKLVEAGGTPPPGDVQWLQQEELAAGRARQDLSGDRGRLALAGLDAEFREMEKKRAQLQEAYMKGFGSGQERWLLSNLAAHLQAMHRNRVEAQKAGSRTAAAQAAQLAKDIKKMQ